MICAFNAKGFLTDPAMKSAFGLNNKADDKTIQKQLKKDFLWFIKRCAGFRSG